MNRKSTKIATILSLSVALTVIGQPAFAKTGFTTLKSGSKGATVQQVEKMLKALNYDRKLKVDKLYDKNTAYNVKQFQKKTKLKQTGTVNRATYDKLKKAYNDKQKQEKNQQPNTNPNSNSILKLGSKGDEVKALQEDLKALGYSLTVNGTYDASTRLAVMIFQSRNGMKLTGEADSKLVDAIDDAAKQQKSGADKQENSKQEDSKQEVPTDNQTTKPETTAPAPTQPDQNSSNGNQNTEVKLPSELTAEEKEMVQLVNKERTSRGLEPFQVDMKIVKAARAKAQDMVDNHYFSHTSPTYGSPFQMMDQFGINWRAAAENIAQNSSVSGAHSSLMNSAGHKANILNATYTHIGIAVVDGGPHGKTFVQMFVNY